MLSFPDGMKYIGKSLNFELRIKAHERYEQRCPKLHLWKKRYGWCNVSVEKLWESNSNKQLCEKEVEMIAEHCTLWPGGLNMTRGGEGDPEVTREQWKDPDIRARRVQGVTEAWQHPQKRDNLLQGLARSRENATPKTRMAGCGPEANRKRSATWEAKREAVLEQLPPDVADRKRKEMQQNREKALRYKARKKGKAAHIIEISPTAEPRADAGCESDEEGYAWWDAGVRRVL